MNRGVLVCVGFVFLVVFLAFPPIALCGSMNSTAAPTSSASAMYTLDQIYRYLDGNTTVAKRTGAFTEPSAGPTTAGTGHTLDEIMTLIQSKCSP